MNKIWKRVLSLALALVMVLGMAPITSLTADAATGSGTEDDPIVYEALDGVISNATLATSMPSDFGFTWYSGRLISGIRLNGSTRITSQTASGNYSYTHGETFEVEYAYYNSFRDWGYKTAGYAKILTYFNITCNADGATVSPSKAYLNDTVTVTVPHVEGTFPTATYNGGNVELTQNGDVWTGTLTAVASGEVTVTYNNAEVEKYTVTVQTFGNGSATVDVIEAIAGTKVNVTATPNAGTDSVNNYLVSITVNGTAIEGDSFILEEDSTVVVTFTTLEIDLPDSGIIYRNGALADSFSKLDNLKADVLAAAGITEDLDSYTVYLSVTTTIFGSTITNNYNVEDEGTANQTIMAAAMSVGSYNTFVVVKTDGVVEVKDSISILVADSRAILDITASQDAITFEGKTEVENIQEAVKELFTITATDPQTGIVTTVAVSDSYLSWEPDYEWPEDGADPKVFTVTCKVNLTTLGETYQNNPEVSVTVTLVDTTILYTVEFVNGKGDTTGVIVPEGTAVAAPTAPEHEYYDFVGWYIGEEAYDFTAAVNSNLTLTAKWSAKLDNNGNGIADQEETYNIVYVLGNGEADIVFTANWGDVTPQPELESNPVRDGYNFKGWETIAEIVEAPAEGNTITYNALWTKAYIITYVDRDNAPVYVEVEQGMIIEAPADPIWDADHDFLGWFIEGETEAYVFGGIAEGNVTLVAQWRTDVNHNDIEDTTEPTYTVIYDVDGVQTVFDVLTLLPTPAVADPVKSGYIFNGWTPAVAEIVTGDAIYVATWLDDSNNNGVDDTYETITVVIEGNGSVTINGNAGSTYVYDSTGTGTITVVASPVITDGYTDTYVARISVAGTDAALNYLSNYSATYSYTADGSHTVTVVFNDAGFIFNEDAILNYYPGMDTTLIKNEDVYNTFVAYPELVDGCEYTIQYFARPASSVTVTLTDRGLGSTIDALLKTVGYETITIDLDELWLDVNVEDMSALIQDSVDLDTAVTLYLNEETIANLVALYNEKNTGGIMGPINAIAAVTEELGNIIAKIQYAAMYYGAHNFGYNDTDAEVITELVRFTYKNDERSIAAETTIQLQDLRAPSYVWTNNADNAFEVIYRDYTDESLAELIGAYITDAEGNKLEGTVSCITLVESTFEGTGVSENAYELVFKFAGNDTHKPSQTTVYVTVVKADASYDAPNVNITYGDSYEMLGDETITLGNAYGDKAELVDSMIQFVIGLDIADLDIDGDGITGLSSRIQIILPAELKSVLDMITSITGGNVEEGIEMSLSELTEYLQYIESDSLGTLTQALEAIAGIIEGTDLKIVLGGSLPTDVGAYLYGAVSTSSNYETAFDVSYILIAPDATQVYLDWNYSETNGIFSWDLLDLKDLGASAYEDEAFTVKNEDASALINNVFFGVTVDAEGNFELITQLVPAGGELDESTMKHGAYTQLAFIADFGNELYYALPIVRAFVLVPDQYDVQIVDKDGNALDNFTFTYDKTAQELFVMVDGELMPLDITYAGIRTNTQTYGPTTEAPVHAGAYGAVVVYMPTNEYGVVTGLGLDVATLVIEPAQSEISVTGGTFAYDGQAHGVTVVAPTPDVTLISVYLDYNAAVDGLKIEDITAVMNVSLPQWLEDILADKYPNAYANGITKADLQRELLENADALLELGLTEEMLNSMKNLLKNIPFEMNITFSGIVEYTEPGAYAYIGIVTDSDYIPSYDTGLVVIQKEGQVLDMMDTTVTWDGNGHFIDVYNQPATDYVTIIIDRENNIGNILLEDDLMDLIAILEDSLGINIPESIDVGALQAEIREVLAQVEAYEDLPAEVTEALTMVYDLLNSLPQDGIIYINGEWLPTEVGQYEFYGASYSAQYATNLTQGILTIVPVEVEITVDSNEKVYGTEDPERTYTVKYYDHLGNELTGIAADLVVEILRAEGENVGQYLYTANVILEDEHFNVVFVTEDATLTITPAELTITVDDQNKTYGDADPDLTYSIDGLVGEDVLDVTVTREEGENVGTYVINASAEDANYIITVIPGTLTITEKTVTITVDNQEKIYGNADPELTYTVDGLVEGDDLNIVITREEGENVGIYAIITTAENANYIIVINDAQLEIKKATVIVTVKDQDVHINADDEVPAITAEDLIIECDGVVTEEELGLKVYWDVDMLDGELVEGSYIAYAEYNTSDNFTVIVNGAATADDPYVPGEIMPRLIVGNEDYVCWNVQTGVYYTDLSDALEVNDGEEAETIRMLKNYEEKYVIIAPGTTLDLDKYTVTAKFVVGLNGSYLTGVPYTAKLIVGKNNLSLAEECYNDGAYDILPVYDASINGFRLARFSVNTDESKNRGLTVDEENDTLYFQFVVNTTKEIRQLLLSNGTEDNELRIVVRLEWNTGDGIAYQDFVYSDELVAKMYAGGTDLTFTLTGFSALGIDLSTLTVRGMVVTNSDAVSSGAIHIA